VKKIYEITNYLGIELSAKQQEQFLVYRRELIEWNKKFNLTAITSPEEIEQKHFADSLTGLLALDDRRLKQHLEIADIGTGAGFPGLPIKIVLPHIHLTLIDSTAKKALFVNHVISRLGIEGAEFVTGRAEDIARNRSYRERFDVVLSRAVARLNTLAELCLPLCKTGGQLIAYKKGDQNQELAAGAVAIRSMGGEAVSVLPVSIAGLADGRYLVSVQKARVTPETYPRRPGIPGKNPL